MKVKRKPVKAGSNRSGSGHGVPTKKLIKIKSKINVK
jgi:hypothetical protein